MRQFLFLALTVLIAFISTARGGDHKFRIKRTEVLARNGTVLTQNYQLFPVKKGAGKILEQKITPGITGERMRIHFILDRPTSRTGLTIKVIDETDREWSITDSSSELSSFWTPDLSGSTALVQLFSESGVNSAKITIDKIALSFPPIVPQSLTVNQLKPILTQTPQIKSWGSAVARVRFVGDDGGQYFCTGFLVSSRLFLTNQHCISSADEMRSALVDFNYDSDTAQVNTITCTEIVAVDEDLDYSLLRLASSPSATPLKLTSESVSDPQPLLIIQHPGGDSKQVSIVECKVLKADVPGVSGQTTDFGHYCDTLGGSSGSPVQNIVTGTVVGLHHLGIPENSTTLTNQAIKMSLILKSLSQKSPAILGEIGMGAKN